MGGRIQPITMEERVSLIDLMFLTQGTLRPHVRVEAEMPDNENLHGFMLHYVGRTSYIAVSRRHAPQIVEYTLVEDFMRPTKMGYYDRRVTYYDLLTYCVRKIQEHRA